MSKMKLKGSVIVVGVSLLLGTASGWSSFPRRYRHQPAPCSLAPWRSFPLAELSHFDSFFNDWPSLTHNPLWPLGLWYEGDWGRQQLESNHLGYEGVGSSGNNADDREKDRLEQLYQDSFQKSERVQEEMDNVQEQLDHLNQRSVRNGQITRDSCAPKRSCDQYRKQPIHCPGEHVQESRHNPSKAPVRDDSCESSRSCNRCTNQPSSRQRVQEPSDNPPESPVYEQYRPESNLHQTNPTPGQSNPTRREADPSLHHTNAATERHVHDRRQAEAAQPQHRQVNPAQRQPNGRREAETSQRQAANYDDARQYRTTPQGEHHATHRHSQRPREPTRRQYEDVHQPSQQKQPNSSSPKQNTGQFSSDRNRQRDPTTESSLEEVMLIPTRGFNPRDLNIRHHGNSIRVHASRTCDGDRTCVTREMETSYKLPYEIERGSMKASIDGSNIVIKGRPVQSQDIEILVEEEPDDNLVGDNSFDNFEENLHKHWVLEDSDAESGVSVESEAD